MFANRMMVQVTIKCQTCPRTGTTAAQLCPGTYTGEMVLRSDNMPLPTDWKPAGVDSLTQELICPICAGEEL